MRDVSVDEYQEQVLLEVIGIVRESGRDGLVEPLKAIIEDFNNRILNLVVENVNLDSCNTDLYNRIPKPGRCNTDLDTKDTDLVLGVKALENAVERLEWVIGDREEKIRDLEDEIVELNGKLDSVREVGV